MHSDIRLISMHKLSGYLSHVSKYQSVGKVIIGKDPLSIISSVTQGSNFQNKHVPKELILIPLKD